MFEFLFKYPETTWNHAEFVWASDWPVIALPLAVAVAAVLIIFSLFRQKLSLAKRGVIALLQLVAAMVVLAMLWQPSLRIELMQSGENSVAYLLDISNSMQTNDAASNARIDAAKAVIDNPALIKSEWFDASVFGVADSLVELDVTANLNDQLTALTLSNEMNTDRSAIADNLLAVLKTVNEQSLAAVVMFSDGADNASKLGSEWWQSVIAAGIPVHTVGFGSELVENDIELSDVEIDADVSENASVTAHLRITHNGATSARIRIKSGNELLHAENITLPTDQAESIHAVQFNSGEAGLRELEFSVTADDGLREDNLVNNVQSRMLNVSGQSRRILYVEGEPRWEYKFIRRALHNFSGVDIVSLLRTSPNKFYRQGVASPQELADGFPTSREQLFQYNAVIIGSLEAAELSVEQQANLRDFVAVRGGSLLMLSGSDGLGDGGWGRSATAIALPVTLSSRTNARDYKRERATVKPTMQGARAPYLKLEQDEVENVQTWASLPEVADHQALGTPKPGSTVLLSATSEDGTAPLLVWHRYGQGQSFVLGTSGTWRWQMGLPSENQWHERFWQQLLSHLAVSSVPQLSFETTSPVYRDVDAIPLEVTARQADFQPMTSGELAVTVISPSGLEEQIMLTADVDQPGKYRGAIETTEDGPYAVAVSAPIPGEAQAAASATESTRWLIKESGTAEQFGSRLHKAFLQRVSEVTGGRYLDASEHEQLAEVLSISNAGITKEQHLPLWNMPLLFFILALVKAAEWILRLRWKRI